MTHQTILKFLGTCGLAACLLGPQAAQARCTVATDASGDVPYGNYDIESIIMDGFGATLQVQLAMASTDQLTVGTDFFVHWVDQDGIGWFVGTYIAASVADLPAFHTLYGSYDPASGSYQRTFGNTDESISVDYSGGLVSVVIPSSYVGSPSSMTGIGAVVAIGPDTEASNFSGSALGANFVVDSTANDGEWAVGSSCARSSARAEPAQNTVAAESLRAGALPGWLLLLLISGFRVRRRKARSTG